MSRTYPSDHTIPEAFQRQLATKQSSASSSQSAGRRFSSPSLGGNIPEEQGFANGDGVPDDFKHFLEMHPGMSFEEAKHLRAIFNKRSTKDYARLNLARWYNRVAESGFKSFNTIAATFYEHSDEILNFYENSSTNASAESINSKIKAFRAKLHGVNDTKFFIFRLCKTQVYYHAPPQTMEQFVMGYKCYLSLLRTGEHCGYSTIFVYNDSLQRFLSADGIVNRNTPIVYHIGTSDIQDLDIISDMLRKVHSETAFYMVDDYQQAWFRFGSVIRNTGELLIQLYKLAPQFVDFSKVSEPYAVPDAGVMLDRGMAFNPTRVNTLIGQSMIGNWGFEVENISQEDKAKESANAMANEESFERQVQIINQIKILNSIENSTLLFAGITKQTDCRKAPLILVMPFTSSDHRRQLKDVKIEGFRLHLPHEYLSSWRDKLISVY